MPFDILADFKEPADASKIDRLWSGLARSIVMRLLELEPNLRFRIRNFPPPVSITEGEKGAADIKTGIALSENDVPPALRSHITVPEGEEYWIYNYKCMTCLKPDGQPGLWVPHIRRKLHHDHDLQRMNPTAKGVEQPWTVTHRIVIGDINRIRGLGDLLYSIALTGPVDDIAKLSGYDVVLVLPVQKINVSDQVEALKKVRRLEHSRVYPPDPKAAVAALLEDLKFIDIRCLQPETNTDSPEEDPEYKQQLARQKLATRVLAGMTGAKVASDIKVALKEKSE